MQKLRAVGVFLAMTLILCPAASWANGVFQVNKDAAKSAIDRAIAWLRTQQQDDGSYGKDAETTAMALLGMAFSPREYRVGDGPFVDAAADYLQTAEQSDLVLSALAAVGAKTKNSEKYSVPDLLAANPDIKKIVEQQTSDGSWNQSVKETAQSVLLLAQFCSAKSKKSELSLQQAWEKGVAYLLAQRNGKLWGFGGQPDAGITGMAVAALLAAHNTKNAALSKNPEMHEAIDDALAYLVSLQKENGGIYDQDLANYKTCVAVMALHESGKKEYKSVIDKARDYLISIQASEENGYQPEDKFYGGVGYGSSQRPDLSNTHFALEALHAAGLPKDHPVFLRALKYMSRTQNYSETNTLTATIDGTTYVAGNDGGAGYYPLFSYAGFDTLPNGNQVPKSYGSMSYALLKGYLFAGLAKDDPRMQALISWIENNYTLEENPGFDRSQDPRAGRQGYFYYLFAMAKGLHTAGLEEIKTPDGKTHRWRRELGEILLRMQKPDGSWVNEFSDRWWEGNPLIATSYALATLQYVE